MIAGMENRIFPGGENAPGKKKPRKRRPPRDRGETKAKELSSKAIRAAEEAEERAAFLAKFDALLAARKVRFNAIKDAVRITSGQFSQWQDKGKVTLFQGLRVAEYFGVPLEWLADRRIKTPARPGLGLEERELMKLLKNIGYKLAVELIVEGLARRAGGPGAAGEPKGASGSDRPGLEDDTDGLDQARRKPKGRP